MNEIEQGRAQVELAVKHSILWQCLQVVPTSIPAAYLTLGAAVGLPPNHEGNK